MARAAVVKLEELDQLEPDLLYLFVAGPGTGEGIAVALPGGEWIVLDGASCKQGRGRQRYSIPAIVDRFRTDGDHIAWAVFTHPHADHTAGFDVLLEDDNPRNVGVPGVNSAQNLAKLRRFLRQVDASAASSDRRRKNAVLTTLNAIEAWTERNEKSIRPIAAFSELEVQEDGVKIVACSPDSNVLARLWEDDDSIRASLTSRANALSIVLRIDFGDTHIVLGGDLPHTHNGVLVETGWEKVLRDHTEVMNHSALKVPHHGSREALHPDLMKGTSMERVWVCTPFSRQNLPRQSAQETVEDAVGGLETLLEAEGEVHCTAMSVAMSLQPARPVASVDPPELLRQLKEVSAGNPYGGGKSTLVPGTATGALDAVWAFAFNRTGQCTGAWRGPAAYTVRRVKGGPDGGGSC